MDPSYFTNVSYITVTPSDEGVFRMEFVSSCYLPGKHMLRELYLSPAENLIFECLFNTCLWHTVTDDRPCRSWPCSSVSLTPVLPCECNFLPLWQRIFRNHGVEKPLDFTQESHLQPVLNSRRAQDRGSQREGRRPLTVWWVPGTLLLQHDAIHSH